MTHSSLSHPFDLEDCMYTMDELRQLALCPMDSRKPTAQLANLYLHAPALALMLIPAAKNGDDLAMDLLKSCNIMWRPQ